MLEAIIHEIYEEEDVGDVDRDRSEELDLELGLLELSFLSLLR